MEKKPGLIRCRYFSWTLYVRAGRWYADGRSGNAAKGLGRYSLGAADKAAAIEALHQLDGLRAVELGFAPRTALDDRDATALGLVDGRKRYEAYVARPKVLGGASANTVKRYRPVFDKFLAFAAACRVSTWNAVTADVLERYATHLDAEGYEYATEYLELNTLKQAIKWMVSKSLLPSTAVLNLPLKKPNDTTTYCYTPAEVVAIIEFCKRTQGLRWLGDVVVVLTHTGMRIGELVDARWEDVDDGMKWWEIPDHSRRGTLADRKHGRSNKSRRSRKVPVHPLVREVLQRLRQERHGDGRIMHGPHGGVLKPDTVRIVLKREVLAPLSQEFPALPGADGLIDGRLHSFRHFFCSWCANNAVPERTLMTWLGHADSRMVKRYYHLQDDESRRRMEELALVSETDVAARLIDTTLVPKPAA